MIPSMAESLLMSFITAEEMTPHMVVLETTHFMAVQDTTPYMPIELNLALIMQPHPQQTR